MLLSSWLKKLAQRSHRRGADGKLKKKPSPFTQLGLTRLEDRVVLTVNASLSLGDLVVTLDAANDAATIQVVNGGADIRVDDGTTQMDFAVGSVNDIQLAGSADANQSVTFLDAFSVLPEGISTDVGGTIESLSFTGDVSGITSAGSFDVTVGQLNLGGSIITQDATISLNGVVTLMTDVVLDTTNAGASSGVAITLTGSVDNDASTRDLTIDAGSAGLVTVNATIGTGGSLSDLSITADDVALNSSIAADTVTLAPGGSSAVGVGTDVASGFNVSDVELDRITATTSVTIGGSHATSVVMNNVTDPSGIPLLILDAGAAGATFQSSGTASTVNSLQVTSDGTAQILRTLTVDAGSLSIVTNNAQITVSQTLSGTNTSDISLNSGSATIELNQAVTSDGGTLTLEGRQVNGNGAIVSVNGILNLIPSSATEEINLDRDTLNPNRFYIPYGLRPGGSSSRSVGTGFSLINLGRADGQHSVVFNTMILLDPLNVLAPVGAGNAVLADGLAFGYAIQGTDDASLTIDAGNVRIGGLVSVVNGLNFGQVTTISGTKTLSTSGGDIVLGSLRGGNVILNAGGGNVQFTGPSSGSPPDIGNVTINSAANVDFDGDLASSGTILVSNATGSVSLNQALSATTLSITANDVNVGIGASISVSGTVTLRPDSDTDTIGLGTGSGTFTPGDLSAFVSASNLIIGRSGTGTGAVDINGVDLSAASTALTIYGGSIAVSDLDAGTNSVVLNAQTGAITDRDGATATDITAGALTLNSSTGIGGNSVNAAVEVDATTVSASASASGGVYVNAVGTGGVSMTTSAPDAIGIFGSGETVTLASATTTNGNITAEITGGSLVAQTVTAGGTGDVRLTTSGAGDITVNTVTAIGDRVTLFAGNSLIDGSPASNNVNADELRVSAGNGVGSALDPFETTVTRLEADGHNGGVYINSSGALTIGVASGDPDDIVGVRASGGDIAIHVASPLTVNENVENTGGGNITLTSTADGGNDDHLTINAQVLASGGAGDIVLNAGTDLVINNSGVASDIQNSGSGDIIANVTRDALIGGDVDIVTSGGTVDFNSVRNFSLGSDSTIDATAAGGMFDLAVIGTVDLAAGASISTDSTLNIASATSTTLAAGASLSTNNQQLTLVTDSLEIDATGSISSSTGRTHIRAITAARSIALGTNPSGSLSLSSTELSQITAGVLQIGSSTAGDIMIGASISPPNVSALHLISNGSVTATGGATVSVSGLAINASGAVSLPNQNDVDSLAASITAAGAIMFADSDGLTIETVDGVNGLTTSNGAISVMAVSGAGATGILTVDSAVTAGTGGSITLQALGASGGASPSLQINSDVTASGTGTVTLGGVGITVSSGNDVSTASGSITANADGNTFTLEDSTGPDDRSRLVTTSGTISITADQFVIQNNDTTQAKQIIAGTSSVLTIANSTAGVSIGVGGGVGTLSIDDTELSQMSTNGLVTIGSQTSGILTLDMVDLTNVGTGTDAQFISGATIVDAAGVGPHVIADQLTLDAATGIGSGFGTVNPDPINTQVNSLAARTRTSGDILISDADGVIVTALASGISGISTASNGNIQLTTGGGTLQVDRNIAGGSIDIDATGAVVINPTAIISGGGDGTAVTVDAASLNVPFRLGDFAIKETGTGTVTLNITGQTLLDRLGISAGTGTIAITSSTINSGNSLDGTSEIQTSGDVMLTANEIGANGRMDITSLAPAASTLTLIDTSTTGQGINLDVLTNQFELIEITLSDASSNVRVGLPAGDIIQVTGSATQSSLSGELRTNTVALTFEQKETGADVLVATSALAAGGALIIRSEDDIQVGTTNGTAINAAAGAYNVTLEADRDGDGTGRILTSNAVVALNGGSLLLRAGNGIGVSGTPLKTTGLTDLAAETETGGIFVSNATSGTVNVTSINGTDGVAALMSGDIVITNTADGLTTSQDMTTASGTITLNISGSTSLGSGVDIDSTSGTITLNTNDLSIDATATIDSGTARTIIRPTTGGGAIDVNLGTDTGGSLSLTDVELDRITAGVLEIGSAATGAITVTSTATLNAAQVDTVRLITGSSISQSGGPFSVQDLAVSATGPVTLSNAGNDFDRVAVAASAAGAITLVDTDDLTVDLIDGVSGVSTVNGAISVTTGDLLTVNRAVTTGMNGTISISASDLALNAALNSGSGNVSIGPSQIGGATVGLGAGGQTFDLEDAELDLITTTGTLTIGGANATAIIVDGVTDPAGIANFVLDATRENASVTLQNAASQFNQLTINADDGVFIRTNLTSNTTLTIDGDADNNTDTTDAVTIGNGGSDVTVTADGTLAIDAMTGGVVLDGTDGSTTIVTSTGDALVTLGATTNGGTNPNLVVNSQGGATIASVNTGTGSITLNVDTDGDTAAALSTGSLTGGNIALDSGNDLNDSAMLTGSINASGTFTVTDFASLDLSASGGVTAAGDVSVTIRGGLNVSTDIQSTTGNIMLTTVDTGAATEHLAVAGGISVTADAGSVTLRAGDNLTTAAAASISAGGGVTLTAAFGDVDSLGAITLADTSTVESTGGGTLDLDARGNIALSALSTTGEVQITTTNGAIIDNGDNGPDITAGLIALRAATGIGDDLNSLETTEATVSAGVSLAAETESGDIALLNTGGLTIGTVNGLSGVKISDAPSNNNSGLDNISLTANSPLTINADVVDSDGGNISLTAGGSAAGDDLTINANVTAEGGNGNIALSAGSDILQTSGTVSAAGSGTISYSASTGTVDGVLTMSNGTQATATTGAISLSAAGDITLGGLTTGNATTVAVSVTSTTGAILDGGDAHTDVTTTNASARVVLSASTGIGTGNAIDTSIAALDASVTGTGDLSINEADAINLLDLDTTDGAINVVADGMLTATDVAAGGAGDTDDVTLQGTSIEIGTISAASLGDISLVATSGEIDDADANSSVSADDLSFSAVTGFGTTNAINTTVNEITSGATSGSGQIAINETDAVVLTSLQSGNGLITVTAGGQITATSVVSQANDDANDITLISTGAGIQAISINAGSSGDVTLNAQGGAITDDGTVATDVTADVLTADAAGSITLDTDVASIDASTTAAGSISIDELNAVVLTDVQTSNGSIAMTAGGQITATSVVSQTDDDANDISLASINGGIQAVSINAGSSGDVTLDAQGGAITDDGTGATDLTADVLTADAAGAITLDTDVSSVDAATTAAGAISLDELNDVVLTDVQTSDGAITVTAGGELTATIVISQTSSDTNDISLSTSSGDIRIGAIAATGAGDVVITAAANIVDDNGATANVTADDLTLTAQQIATPADALETVVSNLEATASTGSLSVVNSGDLTIGGIGVTTGASSTGDLSIITAGNLTVDELVASNGGNLTLTATLSIAVNANIESSNGVITLTADSAGAGNAATLTIADATTIDGGSGLVDLNADGNVTLGRVVTTGDVTINSAAGELVDGGDTGGTDISAATLTINTQSGIGISAGGGADAAVETAISTLNASTTDGSIQIDEADGATLVTVTAGGSGDIRIVSATGNLVLQTITADGNLVALTATAGAITDASAGETANITAADAALRASTGIGDASIDDGDIDLAIATLAATTAAGDISVSDDGDLQITTVDSLTGIEITTGGAGDDILIREGATGDFELAAGASIVNSGTGNITLVADGAGTSDDFIIRADISANGGDVLIVSFDAVDFVGSPTVSATGSGTVTIHAGRTFDFTTGVGATGTGTTDASILDAVLATIQTDAGGITLTANNNVSLDLVNADADGSGAAGTVVITADADSNGTGAIIDGRAGENVNIIAAAAALRAAEGIGSGDDLNTNLGTVAAFNTTSGTVEITNDFGTDLSIGMVDGLAGIISDAEAIRVVNPNGVLTVDESVATPAGTTGSLNVTGAVVVNASVTAGQFDVTLIGNANGDLVINSDLTSSSSLALSASQDVIVNSTVQTNGTGADITIRADSDGNGMGGVQVTTSGQIDSADDVTITGSDLVADATGSESVQIDSDGTTPQILAVGNVSISAGTDAADMTDLEINGRIESTGAATTITIAANRDVLFGVNGDVIRSDAGASGLISVFADQASLASAGGVITMADGTVINGGGGQIEVVADGRLTLGQIITTDLINLGSGTGDVVDGGDTGGVDLIASSLAIAGFTGVGTDTDAIDTQVTTIAGRTNSGDFHVSNSDGLIIGTVNLTAKVAALLGMATADGVAVLNGAATDNVTITASSLLTVVADVTNNGGGDVTLTATNDGGDDDHLTISANVTATGGSGSIDLNAGTDLLVNSDATVSTVGSGAITGDADRAILVSGTNTLLQSASGVISFTANAGGHSGNFAGITIDDATIETTSGTISLTGTGGNTGDGNHGVLLSNSASLTSTIDAAIISIIGTAGVGASSDGARVVDSAVATSDASISISGSSATSDGVVISNSLLLTVSDSANLSINGTTTGTDIGSDGVTIGSGTTLNTFGDSAAISITGTSAGDDGVSLSVSTISTTGTAATISIAGSSTGTGGDNSDGVNLEGASAQIASVSGAITVSGTASGGAAGDGVEISAGVTEAIAATGTATITITGTGDAANSGVQINSPISSGTGTITIRSEDGGSATDDISFGVGGDITSASGTITIDAENAGNTADGFTADGTVINAGSGLIDIDADVDVTLGGLITTGEIQITAVAGAIIDGGNANADLTAATAALRAALGIGDDGNSLETVSDVTAGSLTIAALTDSGDISISNTGHLIVGIVDSLSGVTISDAAFDDNFGTDNITLIAGSPLTVNNNVTNSDGGSINLTASDSTAAGDDLTVATGVAIATAGGNGSITLNAGDDLVLNGTASVSAAGTGAVSLTANAGPADTVGAITMANGATVTSALGTLALSATDDITLGGLSTGYGPGTAVMITSSSGAILDGGDADADIAANAAGAVTTLTAAAGIGNDN
ncbi:hypothetical protein GC176_20915, partial [bacterium]|nr:hypothetical protein [bacterium]